MTVPTPHYLLFSDARRECNSGRWRFVLRAADGSQELEVADREPGVWGERLDLLTVVRALEALDQPSHVTLVGCSPYVRQGMRYGLADWRTNGWRWEFFGQMVPVKNGDLWQRLDQAMRYHQLEWGRRRVGSPRGPGAGCELVDSVRGLLRRAAELTIRLARGCRLEYRMPLVLLRRRRIGVLVRLWRRRVRRSRTALVSCVGAG
jgi:ribonuclease HI